LLILDVLFGPKSKSPNKSIYCVVLFELYVTLFYDELPMSSKSSNDATVCY